MLVGAMLTLPGCGERVTPVSAYRGTVTISLRTDGTDAFVSLEPNLGIDGCPTFGARATIDGREMLQTQFGGKVTSGSVGGPTQTYCDFATYRVDAPRLQETTVPSVRVWDETGEIRLTVADALTEPKLLWDGASELRPGDTGAFLILPDSLEWADRLYVEVHGLDGSPDWGSSARAVGNRLTFTVPESAQPGHARARVRYEWGSQLRAQVTECAGAFACVGEVTLADTTTVPITIVPSN